MKLLLLACVLGAAGPAPFTLSEPRWVVPSPSLPAELPVQASNNNVAIALHEGRLYMAWRSAPHHFAGPRSELLVASSPDLGRTWTAEHRVRLGADVREPTLVSFRGTLLLYYLELGRSALRFEPRRVWVERRLGPGRWGERRPVGEPGEVPWELKERGGRLWLSSYRGPHVQLTRSSAVEVRLKVSEDGLDWRPADPMRPVSYAGGVSEVAFEFDEAGGLWAVGRNEDGDRTGFGAQLFSAPAERPAHWAFEPRSLPVRFDSPRMFREGGELYLVARRSLADPFDRSPRWLPFGLRRVHNLLVYSLTPKRSSLYRLDRGRRRVERLADLPSAGDTAFPSLLRLGPGRWLLANYSSPLDMGGASWVRGQLSPRGTGIYLLELSFRD